MEMPALDRLDTSSQVSIAVAKKTLDASKSQGEAAVALIQSALDLARSSASAVPDVNHARAGGLDYYA